MKRNKKERVIKRPKVKRLFLDIECDFKKHLLSIGLCDNERKFNKEYFIWQKEECLYYPEKVDKKYLVVLDQWRDAVKTPIGDVMSELDELSKEYEIVGWNIKNYDIPILNKYFKKYLQKEWKPKFFDGLLALRGYYAKHKRCSFPLSDDKVKRCLSAESVFKWVTGCFSYVERHTALADAQDERHLINLLIRRYGKKYVECNPA
jgi:hypothetical protein